MQQHIGQRLGAYQIVEQIGQGGMATVFKAYQPSMDRYVAIKILPIHFTEDESFVGRFTQEARTLAHLEHLHILPVHEYGEQDGTTYLVMRHVEGGTLKDVIAQDGPMELEEAARILGQVGGALDYAHSQGVVHRDIKPSNVLVDRQGNTFLTDFGIAKLVAETAQFTATGAIIGTPAYMSPEQGLGQPTDYRCDIYSLGVVLYEMVTGRVPFEAETPLAVLLKHINDPLQPPRQIKTDLPEAVERVILKAMAKSPDDRFQSAQEMIDALAEAVAGMPAEIVSPPLPAGAAEATTLARGISTPLPPVAEPVTPPPVPEASLPVPAVDTASLASVPDTAPLPPAVDTTPPRVEAAAPARSQKRWLFLAGGALLLVLLLAGGLWAVSNLTGGESTPEAAGQVLATPAAEGQAQVSPTEATQTQDTPAAESQPAAAPSPAEPEPVQSASGWTSWGNGNFVAAMARQGDTLWAGGESGLVRWDLPEGSYTKLGRPDGLASVHINDLLLDGAGVLWVATDAGVNRYDGQTMITYDETDGLDANVIEALFLDTKGGLWAGSRGGERGLNYYDGQGWGPPPIPPLPVEYTNVRVLGGTEADGLFVGLEDQGLALFDGQEWTVLTSADGLPGDTVLDALVTDEALWVSFDPAIARFDLQMGENERFGLQTGGPEIIPQPYIYTIHQAADGALWFGGEERALRFDQDFGDWQEFKTSTGTIPDGPVTDIAEDENGLWFSTLGGGVALYDGSHWETWATDEVLGGNVIEAIRQGKDGALWFTHPGTGLSRYEPDHDAWQVFGETEGASEWPPIPAIDSAGNLWIGEDDELVRYDDQAWERFTAPELAEVEIWAIDIGPDDTKWLALNTGLLMRHNPVTDQWTTFTGSDHPIIEDIWSFLASSDGTLWVGGEDELVQYDGSTWGTPAASGNAPQLVDYLAEAPDGSLWVAADGELGHLAGGQWAYHAWPSEGWLERVAVGPDGIVWAGLEGLGRYDPTSGEWQMFTSADGLVHNIVQAIHVTPEGVVWVGTEGGVSRFVPPE
jgi:serine/threonine protein kinase/ligand-binding sensor domain-containing protein